MKPSKQQLLSVVKKVNKEDPLTIEDLDTLAAFHKADKEPLVETLLKGSALPLSLLFGIAMTMFPEYFDATAAHLPAWTNLSPKLLAGIDYIWNIIGDPVKKQNIIFHLPNVALYSFGILGVKKIFDSIDRQTWVHKVERAQGVVQERTKQGTITYSLPQGHSILFIGKGDHIGKQFVLNHEKPETVTVAEIKPAYTDIWNYYDTVRSYDELADVLTRAGNITAGEYVFFPVKDDQVFLPSDTAYDLSPYKLDILCQNIRKIEKERSITPKRIIIIGDRNHQSRVQSEDQHAVIEGSYDVISLESISRKYENVTLLDPTDIVLNKILAHAQGRKIVFRATKEGIREYKQRFYNRLESSGYSVGENVKGTVTIGYDLFEDQTEQQTLAHVVDDYFPVVVTKSVRDALVRNGYTEKEFLYVPELVLSTLDTVAAEQ